MKMSIIILATKSCKYACSLTQFLKSFLYKHLKIVLITVGYGSKVEYLVVETRGQGFESSIQHRIHL
jgi:hypothetical protein